MEIDGLWNGFLVRSERLPSHVSSSSWRKAPTGTKVVYQHFLSTVINSELLAFCNISCPPYPSDFGNLLDVRYSVERRELVIHSSAPHIDLLRSMVALNT